MKGSMYMGLEISKCYSSYSFILSKPNFMVNKAVIREYKFIIFLGDLPKIKNFVAV